ncbi:golgin subfamily A member 6-like protein 24 [Macrobrachium nipponense]|uniref:golgin subfamily A member 6-like protein 24 n=1 Tax=Macrobrachium nipponense TaxID=159736 RepID=UPI0030C89E27
MAVKYLVVLVCAVLAMFLNNLVSCVQEGLVSLYNLYFGRDVAVTLFRIDEALVCERPVVTPANTASWWTGGIPLVAVVAGGAACLTSLALATWKIRRHEATRKQLLEEAEDLRRENTCVVAEFRKREQELISKNEELDAELQRFKEDNYVLEEKLLGMERLLEESRHSKEDLMTTYDYVIVDKERQIEELLAQEEKNKEDYAHLERKLLDSLSNNEEMERRMKDAAELSIYHQTLIEGKDEQIQVLLAKEDEFKEACDRLERNLLEALSRNEDMEMLLDEKEREKKELNNLFDNLIEKKDNQIKDFSVQEAEMKKVCELLEGKLLNAVKSKMDVQQHLKEKEEQLTTCQTEIEVKDEKIQALLSKEDEMHEACELLKRKLHNALSNKDDMGRLLKEKEDEKTELVVYCETQIQEIEKVLKMEKEQNLELTNNYEETVEDLFVSCKDLLAKEVALKEEREYLAVKLEEALNTVEELEKLLKKEKDEKLELTINYEEMVEDVYASFKDLLAKEVALKEEKEYLAVKLEEALNTVEELEKLLTKEKDEKLELTINYEEMVEDVYASFKDLLAKEVALKEEKEFLSEKLGETLNTVEELEKLLKKEKDEKLELTINYEETVEDVYASFKDLLAKEVALKEEKELLEKELKDLLVKKEKLENSKESLEDKLEEALCCSHRMEKLWKEEQELKLTMEVKWQQAMKEKEEELNMWRQKCEESDVKERLRERTEKQNLEKLQELTEKCEELQKKCQAAEEDKAKEELSNREWRRKQAEALRKQDKFLLMRLFNGITHRNNLLENTEKEEGERNEQENLSHQEYCCDQDEKRGYLKNQWSAVNNIVEDILKGQSSAEKSSSSMAGTSATEDGNCWSPRDAAD